MAKILLKLSFKNMNFFTKYFKECTLLSNFKIKVFYPFWRERESRVLFAHQLESIKKYENYYVFSKYHKCVLSHFTLMMDHTN